MKLLKHSLAILLSTAAVLAAVFLVGRYGWKIGGFRVCESAGIEQVIVKENQVQICGFYPGSFPQGFLGYHAEQVDSTLYGTTLGSDPMWLKKKLAAEQK